MKRPIISLIISAFLANAFVPLAQAESVSLPGPGRMIGTTSAFQPPVLKGIKIYPDNPLKLDFVLDPGVQGAVSEGQMKEESAKLVKYFLAALTVPEKDFWVNLSPYERDRIAPEAFGQTEMGQDLLAQDYLLKQLTASLLYPEGKTGKEFWGRIYKEAAAKFGRTDIPVNTYNKVWIVPSDSVVYENARAKTAYVLKSHFKVLLEEDYLAMKKNGRSGSVADSSSLASGVLRDVVIPALTREVNEGQTFAPLRQIHHSLMLAGWYKRKVKDGILAAVYADHNKIVGVNADDPEQKQKIYGLYLQAFKKGVYNYVKEETDAASGQSVPRKYISGGIVLTGDVQIRSQVDAGLALPDHAMIVTAGIEESPLLGDKPVPDIERVFDSDDQEKNITFERAGKFLVVSAPGRAGKRKPAYPFEKVVTPFDDSAFNFTHIDEGEIFWKGRLKGTWTWLVGQMWPFAHRHFLLLPEPTKKRPQVIREHDLRLALHVLRGQPSYSRIRLFFNSLKSGASINHLHLQGFMMPDNLSPLERADTDTLAVAAGVTIGRVRDYPVQALLFRGGDITRVSQAAYTFIKTLQKEDIPHMVVMVPAGIYVIPSGPNVISALGNTWTSYEVMGFILKPPVGEHSAIDEKFITEELLKMNIPPERFEEVVHKALPFLAPAMHGRFRNLVLEGGAEVVLPSELDENYVAAVRQGGRDYTITFEGKAPALELPEYFGFNSTGSHLLDERLELLEAIRAADQRRTDKNVPLVILDWGAGDATGLVGLQKDLEKIGIANVRLLGYSNRLYQEWHRAPAGITFLTDLSYLNGQSIDVIYSHLGLRHLIRGKSFEDFKAHLAQLARLLDRHGVLRVSPIDADVREALAKFFPLIQTIDKQDEEYEGAVYIQAAHDEHSRSYQIAEDFRKRRLNGEYMERGFWQDEDSAKYSVIVTLDTIPGFKEARQAKDIKTMAGLYRKYVIDYRSTKDKANGQLAFFYENGGLKGLVSHPRAFLGKMSSAASLLKFALPGLIDLTNPDALDPLEAETDYWLDPNNAKYHIFQALDLVPGFKTAREANDIKTMAALYREHVIAYVSEEGGDRNGQLAFFKEKGGLKSLVEYPRDYLAKTSSPASLLRFALPGLIDLTNPDALDPLDVERSYWTDLGNVKYHVYQMLDAVPGFKEAREANDIKTMADLYRSFVIRYQSPAGRSGQQAFFFEKGGLKSLLSYRHPSLEKMGSPASVLRLVLPGLIDDANPNALHSSEVERGVSGSGDQAMMAVAAEDYGGIDLTPAANPDVRHDAEGDIHFKFDPALLQRLQNAPGFVPVILNIQPATDLKMFLGML